MFTGRQQRRSSNVRVMQLFHELKPQFPTIPDHVITTCIATYLQSIADQSQTSKNPAHQSRELADLLETARSESGEQMGRPFSSTPTSLSDAPVSLSTTPQRSQTPPTFRRHKETIDDRQPPPIEMNAALAGVRRSDNDVNDALANAKPDCESVNGALGSVRGIGGVSEPLGSDTAPKRPNTLNIRKDKNEFGKLQLSEKCKNVHKLLNSPNFSDKPPRSPISSKRLFNKLSPTSAKKETVSTPTQTTDTLVNNCIASPTASVNLSLNVNCQMGLVQSPPPRPKCTATLQVTPTQPWLNPVPASNDATSPRSFTSVNLTLRPPTSEPQNPIDITSQNSSLTYSTSSFDKEKGLQSRLQITVGPGGGAVSSVRARPRSSYLEEGQTVPPEMPARAGSLSNLSAVNSEPPVLLKQQARIERMRIELRTEKAKLVIMKKEVADLENRLPPTTERRTDEEVEKQLIMEIKHLRRQCEMLALDDKDEEEFYNNIYTGPRGSLIAGDLPNINPRVIRRQARGRLQYQGPRTPTAPPDLLDGPKWSCSLCTFLNHPVLDKCEQCEMPRVLHGTRTHPVDNFRVLESLQHPRNVPEGFRDNSHLEGNFSRFSNNAPYAPHISNTGFTNNSHLVGNLSHLGNNVADHLHRSYSASSALTNNVGNSIILGNNATDALQRSSSAGNAGAMVSSSNTFGNVGRSVSLDTNVLGNFAVTNNNRPEAFNNNVIVNGFNNNLMNCINGIGNAAASQTGGNDMCVVANSKEAIHSMLAQSADKLREFSLKEVGGITNDNNFNNINTIGCVGNVNGNCDLTATSESILNGFKPKYASTEIKSHGKQ